VPETGCSNEHLSLSQPSNEKENKIRIPRMAKTRAEPVTRTLGIGVLILAHRRLILNCFTIPARRKTVNSSPASTRLSSSLDFRILGNPLVEQALSLPAYGQGYAKQEMQCEQWCKTKGEREKPFAPRSHPAQDTAVPS
jgi:hypothetical protein